MKKIMFNDKFGLTEAVLRGRKTMTRRVIRNLSNFDPRQDWMARGVNDKGKANIAIFHNETYKYSIYPQYQPGEVVAVAQSYKSIHEAMMSGDDYGDSKYDAFRSAVVAGTKGWTNKMFVRADLMPYRIKITDIKAEKLQDISDEDCLKEGVYYDADVDGYKVFNLSLPNKGWGRLFRQMYFKTPREAFAALIERPGIGHKGDWSKNPWVFVYSFELIKL